MRSVGDSAALPHLDRIAVAEHKARGEVWVVERPGGISGTCLVEHDPIPGPPDKATLLAIDRRVGREPEGEAFGPDDGEVAAVVCSGSQTGSRAPACPSRMPATGFARPNANFTGFGHPVSREMDSPFRR